MIHSDLPTERDARDMFTDELDATDIMEDSARLDASDILLAYAHEVRADARSGKPLDGFKLGRIAEIALSLSSDTAPAIFGDQEAIDWPVDADGHFSDPI